MWTLQAHRTQKFRAIFSRQKHLDFARRCRVGPEKVKVQTSDTESPGMKGMKCVNNCLSLMLAM